jgi:hypothetical protein
MLLKAAPAVWHAACIDFRHPTIGTSARSFHSRAGTLVPTSPQAPIPQGVGTILGWQRAGSWPSSRMGDCDGRHAP